jgi:NAD(P)H dehydrogenase (quinone)
MKVLVVVASQTGRTRRMAEAFAEGAREAGAETELSAADAADPERVRGCDALALGSGVHMAGPESSMRVFFERMAPLWMEGALIGKIGAAFVTGGSGGRGGAELTLISLWATLAEHGLLLVPMHNRLPHYGEAGCHWGPVAWTNASSGDLGPTSQHLEAARAHGGYVAECVARWGLRQSGV